MSPAQPVEILLVEDDPHDAELALRALRQKRLANGLVHAKDGEEALALLFNGEPVPRVVLLDLKMPKIDGLEVLRRLRADERTRTVPVVILTSSKEEPDIEAAYELGVNSYIVKPVEFEKFQEAVANVGYYWMAYNESPL